MDGLMAESFSFLSKILVLKLRRLIHTLKMLTILCLRLEDVGFMQTILIKDHLNVNNWNTGFMT